MAERYFEIHYNNLSTINKKPPNNARSGQVVRAVIYKHFLASSLYCFQAESTSRPPKPLGGHREQNYSER